MRTSFEFLAIVLAAIAMVIFWKAQLAKYWLEFSLAALGMLLVVSLAVGIYQLLSGIGVSVPAAPKAAFYLDRSRLRPVTTTIEQDSKVVLLLVVPSLNADGKIVSRQSYKQTATLAVKLEKDMPVSSNPLITIERGDQDSKSFTFIQQPAGAEQIYVLPEK